MICDLEHRCSKYGRKLKEEGGVGEEEAGAGGGRGGTKWERQDNRGISITARREFIEF